MGLESISVMYEALFLLLVCFKDDITLFCETETW